MHVKINNTDYATIKSLSFAPQVSLTLDSLPIDEFEVDIITDDSISIGGYAELYDDLNEMWARYYLVYAERVDRETVHIRAQSRIELLDRFKMRPIMYTNAAASGIIGSIFASMGIGNSYYLDSTLGAKTITGWCPEQTPRERLQWVLLMIGGYAKSFYTDEGKIELIPVDETSELIPMRRTFWKPSITYRDYVTAVRVKAYSYTQGTPTNTDDWVSDGTNTWIQTSQQFTLYNPNAPANASINYVDIDDVTLVNTSNVSDVMSFLAKYYFTRGSVTMDVINNGVYWPGQKLMAYLDEDNICEGYLESCSFTFGVQARARLELTAVEQKETAGLTIRYMYGTTQLGREQYAFPVGYEYSIQNPYITWEMNNRRYVFRPTTLTCSGTMTSTAQTVDVTYAIALEYYEEGLRVVSVDDVTVSESTTTVDEQQVTTRTAVIA